MATTSLSTEAGPSKGDSTTHAAQVDDKKSAACPTLIAANDLSDIASALPVPGVLPHTNNAADHHDNAGRKSHVLQFDEHGLPLTLLDGGGCLCPKTVQSSE